MKTSDLTVFAALPLLFISLCPEAAQKSENGVHISVDSLDSREPIQGLDAFFTGKVKVEALFSAQGEARSSGANVTFEAGSRTHWHTHPIGQTLIVTSGMGWVQQAGSERIQIQPGDLVSIPANVVHWHGAVSYTSMSHIAIQESKSGSAVTWLEAVTDAQYLNTTLPGAR
ncbi:cupin domain-containing protein [Shewanella sp. FJAT-52076]|uniref:(R)-mandelonitrile lyase n=1 Tax=Shewanella sp. FJAT-52076 TaxID=2864202 RepID=UPI001C65A4BA|nr:cupin domain-containing protein [Shewanella sp. FJAT-52076]QYJ74495.1 cupin domain-containing protein [Shewanella sp. FJAT-52076]